MNNIVFVTSNKNKVREITEILGPKIKFRDVNIPEIQSLSLDEVITEKAKSAYAILKKPVIVEDVSLEIKSLKGLPGPFIKFFLQQLGTEGLLKIAKSKNQKEVTATAAIGLFDGTKLYIFKGQVEGKLAKKSFGESGFGFDKIFIPNGYRQTFAQMEPSIKNQISHRAIAIKKLKEYLK